MNQSGKTGGVIQRYTLPSLTLDTSFFIPSVINSTDGGYVMAMAVAPGDPHTIAVSRALGPVAAGIVVFDDSVQRGSAILDTRDGLHYFSSLQWGTNASTLYSSSYFSPGEYLAMSVDAGGPTILNDSPQVLTLGGHDIHLVPSTGKMYVGNGQVLETSTGQIVGACGAGWAGMVPDPTLGIGFFMEQNHQQSDGGYGVQLHSYNLTTYAAISSTTVPILIIPNITPFNPTRILRCGPSMLALGGSVAGGGSGNICILSGPFVQGK